jgi:hypothetical protein
MLQLYNYGFVTFFFYFVIMYEPIQFENVISFITAYKVHPKEY